MIEPAWLIALLTTILLAMVAMAGLLWMSQTKLHRSMGSLEGKIEERLKHIDEKVNHSCPFGKCPVFERAMKEAAPIRDVPSEDS